MSLRSGMHLLIGALRLFLPDIHFIIVLDGKIYNVGLVAEGLEDFSNHIKSIK